MQHILEQKIANQRKELHALNERNKVINAKLRILDDIDYYKSRLNLIAPNVPYKRAINNIHAKRQIEHIFNLPFNECAGHYKELLDKRNEIAHRHTRGGWSASNVFKRRFTKKTLAQLNSD